jgi:hypothetical protein
VGPRQKRPADLDRAFFFVVSVKSRRSDDLAVLAINGEQRSTGLQGVAKKALENLFLVTIVAGMLFPDERIRSYGVEVMKILCSKRPQLEEFAFQDGLEIKGHLDSMLTVRMVGFLSSFVGAINAGHA